MNKLKKYFISFGAGNQDYYDAVKRITNQASSLDIFDEVIGYTDNDLKNDKYFWNKHSEFILANKRGFGYWLWKPYFIMKKLEQMNDNDILVYADSGCEIPNNNKEKYRQRWVNKFKLVQSDLIIDTLACNGICLEKEWTKMDLILYLNMNNPLYLNTAQHQGSALIILKCKKIVDLVKEWYNTACNYHLLDDTQSIAKNLPCFKEHRHDQSIYSLLVKKYNLHNNYILKDVIWIARNRTGKSKLEY